MRILIADDSETVRQLIATILERAGYHDLHLAADGAETLERARSLKPDLLLLDINMPEMDGFGVLRLLRADAETGGIRIVMHSGRESGLEYDQALAAGADDFIFKPIERRRLLNAVERMDTGKKPVA